MSSRDRALNYAVRVKGQQEAVGAFRSIGQAAKGTIDDVMAAAQAAAAHDEAVGRAAASAAAFGAAQASASQKIAEAKAAFAAGTSTAEQYQTAIQGAKSELSLFKAENQATARQVDATARALVAAQQAAANYGRQTAAAGAPGAAPTAPVVDTRSGAQRLIVGDASVDRAAVSAATLEQVLGRVAVKGGAVGAAMRDASTAEEQNAAAADRLRARYNPLYAVISNYLTTVREIRKAESDGALSADERAAAITRERQATLGAITAIKRQQAELSGSRAQRAGYLDLGYQINDVTTQLSTGTPVMQVFAQQSGQVVSAFTLMAKEGSSMAAVMGGPWGIAIVAGVSLLGLLGAKLFETGHSVGALVDKLKEEEKQSEASRKAKELYKTTLEGVTEAINAETDALKKQADAERTSSEQANIAAKNKLENVLAIRERTVALLKEADAEFELQAHMAGGDPSGGQALAKAASDRQVVKDALARAEADLKQERINVEKTRVNLAEDEAKRMADPIARINKLYDDKAKAAKDSARKEADAGKRVTSVLTDQLAVIEKQRKAALDAQREADRLAKRVNNRETGREVTPQEAAGIARGAGLQVNSVSRTYGQQKQLYDAWIAAGRPADNPVAAPGTSAHEGAKGRWALDIQFGAGVTPDLLRKVFAAQGVNLTKVFKERGHFHVEGSRSQADSSAATEDRAAEDILRHQKEYNDQSAQLDSAILAAKRANINDFDLSAKLDKEQIAVEQQKTELDIKTKVALGDYSVAQGKQLIEKSKQLAAERTWTVMTELAAQHLRDADDLAISASGNRLDLFNAELALAKTTADRRDLALAILAEDEKQARIKAQETIDLFALGKATKEQADAARATLANIDKLHPLQVENIKRQNVGSLGKYLQDTDPKTINDRVETLVTNELTSVRDGINDAITGALGVKDPLLKGLLEMFLDEVIFRPIAEVLDKRKGKGGGLGGMLTSLFGGGAANDNPLAAGNALQGANTTALTANTAALTAVATALTSASALGGLGGGAGGSGGIGGLLGGLFGGGGGGGTAWYDGVGVEDPFVTGGFAGGTSDLPSGLSWVGENGRELLFNGGGGRISVLNNQQSRGAAPSPFVGHRSNTTIVNINSPQPGNPRRIGAVVGRSAQLGAGRAARKGLAAPRSN